MRTLLDLLSDERGYVRIFAEQEGYGYELSTYVRQPVADMFERMDGYGSLAAAQEAARFQLRAADRVKRRRRYAARATSPSVAICSCALCSPRCRDSSPSPSPSAYTNSGSMPRNRRN
jgi:hypothetical protein